MTPSYNQAPYLEAALESVLAQEYPNLEHIVMDGGSTDGSVEIIRRYERHLAYWTSAPDRGQAEALNRGFALATGEILGWLNSDDMLLPDALCTVGAFFGEQPACHFLTGDGVFVDAEDTRQVFEVNAAAYTFRELLHYCDDKYLPQPSVFFSREAFRRVGGLDPTLVYTMDLDLWLRMRPLYELHHIPQRLAKLRIHPLAKGQHAGQPALRATMRTIRQYWSRVSPFERIAIWIGLRRMMAQEECRDGLALVLRGDARGGRRALQAALRWYPAIVTAPAARQLLVRLALPWSLRRRWLRVP